MTDSVTTDNKKYVIVAEERISKIRKPITEPMSLGEANNWKASTWHKQYYRYFRVAEHKKPKKNVKKR